MATEPTRTSRTQANSVSIQGNLARDPELRSTRDGTAVCSFTICNNRFVGKDRPPAESWIDVVTYGGAAENHAKQLGKGHGVLVEGVLTQRSYVDVTSPAGKACKDAGIELRRKAVEIRGDNVVYLSRPATQSNGAVPETAEQSPQAEGEPVF